MAQHAEPRSIADLAAEPSSANPQALWETLSAEDRRRALTLAIGDDRSVRASLVTLLRSTPRYRSFRPTAFASWSAAQFADALKGPGLLSSDVMQAGLIALHVHDRRAMLASFLDSVGVPHTDGLIADLPDSLGVSQTELMTAADRLLEGHPRDEVILYFLTLLVLEPGLWQGLAEWLRLRARAS